MRYIETFLDWLNENPYLILLALILFLSLKCSTPQTTIDIQEKASQTEKAIETGKDGCKSLECQDAMRKSKDYIRDSLDTIKSRDSQISNLENTLVDISKKYDKQITSLNETLSEKDLIIKDLLNELIPWRAIKKWFWITFITLVVGSILYLFRGVIMTGIKTVLKIA